MKADEIMRQLNSDEIHKLKRFMIVLLLWAFAPLAWILMWKDKKYHSWFPRLLVVNGIIFSIIFTLQSIPALENMNIFFEKYGITSFPTRSSLIFYALLLFVVIQIPLGVYLEGFIKRKKHFKDDLVLPLIFIFAIDGLIALATGLLAEINSPTILFFSNPFLK